jgi:hypothetical protein
MDIAQVLLDDLAPYALLLRFTYSSASVKGMPALPILINANRLIIVWSQVLLVPVRVRIAPQP